MHEHTRRCTHGMTTMERLEHYVPDRPEGECWLWTGTPRRPVEGDYGTIWVGGRQLLAHRHAYEMWVGPIPDWADALRHTCDNPPCCNPAHLIPGTHADNVRDAVERGRHWSYETATTCTKGHDLTLPDAITNQGRCRQCREASTAAFKERRAA